MKKISVFFFVLFLLNGCAQTNGPSRDSRVLSKAFSLPLKIPVVMFHYVREVNEKRDVLGYDLSIKPSKFEEFLKFLKKHHFETIHVRDIFLHHLPQNPIIITFDDGYIDYYKTAAPLLKKYGFNASEAIITGLMDGDRYMSPSQVQTIFDNDTEIYSHTVHHNDLVKEKDPQFEIEQSKKELEGLLQATVDGFVYPSGKYDDKTIVLLKNAGYRYAFTTKEGVADFGGDLFQLPRIRIDNRVDFEKVFREFYLIK